MSLIPDFPKLTYSDIKPTYANAHIELGFAGGYYLAPTDKINILPIRAGNSYIVRKVNVSSNAEQGLEKYISQPLVFRFFGEEQVSPLLMQPFYINREGDFPCQASILSSRSINSNNLQIGLSGNLIQPTNIENMDSSSIILNLYFEIYEIGLSKWNKKFTEQGTQEF